MRRKGPFTNEKLRSSDRRIVINWITCDRAVEFVARRSREDAVAAAITGSERLLRARTSAHFIENFNRINCRHG